MSRAAFVNLITFARVPLIFLWLALAVVHEYTFGFWSAFFACAAMLASGLTDLFDGMLARKWRVVSRLGQMADPLMDKVFYVVAFPALTWMALHQNEPECEVHGLVLLAFTILYILRDLWVTFMRSVGTLYGANVSAMWLGKVRTALSFPAAGWIYLYLVGHGLSGDFGGSTALDRAWLASCYVVEGFLLLLNVVSFFTYTRAYLPYLKKALDRAD